MNGYAARFEADDEGFLVTFPALPEAITGGSSDAEAVANAIDALEVTLLTYAGDGRDLPPYEVRSYPQEDGLRIIPVSAAVAAKLAFIEAFRKSGLTRVSLAGRLGKGENEIRRMLDPYHGTRLPAIEEGLAALGKRLVVSVEEAA